MEVVTNTKITKNNWDLWCRLCGARTEDDVEKICRNIFVEKMQQQQQKQHINVIGIVENKELEDDDCSNLSVVKVIEKYLAIKLVNDEQLPKRICDDCYGQLKSLIVFVKRMLRIQAKFNVLTSQDAKIEINSLRVQCTEVVGKIELEDEISVHKEACIKDIADVSNKDEQFANVEYVMDDLNDFALKDHHNESDKDEEINYVRHMSDGQDPQYLSDNSNTNESDIEENSEEEISIANESSLAYENNPLTKTNNKKSVPFTCPECATEFKRGFYYTQHMKMKHNKIVEMPVLKCSECDRVFNSRLLLAKHIKLHLPIEVRRVHKCEECNRNFTNASSLRSHIKYAHKNERNFMCNECGAVFHRIYALKTHMLLHSGLTPFTCAVCKKGFKEKTKLRLHMEIHNSTKYSCSKCDLQFNSRYTLKCHQLVHSDRTPFKCDYCGRELKRSKSFKYHLLRHVGLKPYLCNYCDLTFTTAYYCRMHQQKAHPTEYAALANDTIKGYTVNMPNISELRSITKTSKDLEPVSHSRRKCTATAS